VVQRMAAALAPLHFDRIYGLFTTVINIDTDGHGVVQRSASGTPPGSAATTTT
jgi:hypothetical protein